MEYQYFVVTHFFTDGPAQFFHRYLRKRKVGHLYLEHPFLFAERTRSSFVVIENGEEVKSNRGILFPKNSLLYYARDFFSTLFFGLRHRCAIGIGYDNLNAFALLLLKYLGRLQYVVYVTVDYTPRRFVNTFMNSLYHWIDRYCCYNADLLWDSAERMRDAREQNGVVVSKMKPVIVVDDGNDFSEEKLRPYASLKKYELVYMGHMRKNQGVALLISVAKILHEWNADISLRLIGGGELLETFKKQVRDQGMGHFVHFTGYVDDHEAIQEQLRRSYLAFALYEDDPHSFSKYSAVGKPKVYMGCGLPVIITDVPEVAKKIKDYGAGIVVPYEKEKIIEEIKSFVLHEALYKEMREKAITFARRHTWDIIFDTALQETKQILSRNYA